MTLIGLGHKARQGKNSVANYMKQVNPAIKIFAFADELKLYCKEHHDELVPRWQLRNSTKQLPAWKDDPIYGCSPILQMVGMEFRALDENFWVDKVAEKIVAQQPEAAVITDVRFINEAQWIKENGGFMVEVRRHNADGTQYIDPGRDPNHPSEIALDEYEDWDYIIAVKDGDLKGLKAKSIGVYNLISKPEDYIDYMEKESDTDWAGLDAFYANLDPDSQGDGFKF